MKNLAKIQALVFDFDGVLTNNKVWVDENGIESVVCSRSDGLGFAAFRQKSIPVYIMSTEENPVVRVRAEKLGVPVIQGVKNKSKTLKQLAAQFDWDLSRILFVGNDLNDLSVMISCGFRACPCDSHPQIIEISDFVLELNGGEGVARELAEKIFEFNMTDLGDE